MGGLITFAAVPVRGALSPQLPSGNRNGREKKRTGKEGERPKGKRRKIVTKSQRNRNATVEAKRVAAQLQLMAGQLRRLANQILAETKK